jgi:hypothetical protein
MNSRNAKGRPTGPPGAGVYEGRRGGVNDRLALRHAGAAWPSAHAPSSNVTPALCRGPPGDKGSPLPSSRYSGYTVDTGTSPVRRRALPNRISAETKRERSFSSCIIRSRAGTRSRARGATFATLAGHNFTAHRPQLSQHSSARASQLRSQVLDRRANSPPLQGGEEPGQAQPLSSSASSPGAAARSRSAPAPRPAPGSPGCPAGSASPPPPGTHTESPR